MQAPSLALWLPWSDRTGRVSALKLAVFILALAPGAWMVFEWRMGWLSMKPLTDTIRESGDWALRLLVASLAVTPLRLVMRWNRLILVRRMLGLAALFYTLVHVVLYCFDLQLHFGTIFSEIILRTYLTVGAAATLGLVALGLTSNDLSIHWMGGARWTLLHRIVYATAVLSLLHEFMEVKIDSYEVSLLTGVFVLLMGVRALHRARLSLDFVHLVGLAAAAGVSTALIEAGFYALTTGVNARLVLAANLNFSYVIRPAWWVAAIGVGLAFLSLGRRLRPLRPKSTSGAARRRGVLPVLSGEPPPR